MYLLHNEGCKSITYRTGPSHLIEQAYVKEIKHDLNIYETQSAKKHTFAL